MKTESMAIKNGLFASLGLIAFFLIMQALGFGKITELRFVNIFIIGVFIYRTLKVHKERENSSFSYGNGLKEGMLTTLSAVVIFAGFMLIYLSYLNPDFAQVLAENNPFNRLIMPFEMAIILVLEGLVSGFLVSFTLLQYLRTPRTSADFKEE